MTHGLMERKTIFKVHQLLLWVRGLTKYFNFSQPNFLSISYNEFSWMKIKIVNKRANCRLTWVASCSKLFSTIITYHISKCFTLNKSQWYWWWLLKVQKNSEKLSNFIMVDFFCVSNWRSTNNKLVWAFNCNTKAVLQRFSEAGVPKGSMKNTCYKGHTL